MIKQAHLFIRGDIIGVGFRAWTKIQAKINGVAGWIRNVFNDEHRYGKNGGVEAVLQGDEAKVNMMIDLVKKGPPVSHVEEVEIVWEEPKEIMEDFSIRK